MVALSVALAALVNAVRPNGLDLGTDPRTLVVGKGIPLLDLAEARAAFESGAVFVDARARPAYARGHVEGALSLPPEEIEAAYERWYDYLPTDGSLVVYAGEREPSVAGARATWLRERGHGGTVVFYEGWEAWQAAGLPQSKGED